MPHNNDAVKVRIGIHTGSCVTGLVGTKVPKVGRSVGSTCTLHLGQPVQKS